MAHTVKNLPLMQETQVRSVSQEDPPVKGMATHSSILAWKMPQTEDPGGLQSIGSQRVGRDWATHAGIIIAVLVFEEQRTRVPTAPPQSSHPPGPARSELGCPGWLPWLPSQGRSWAATPRTLTTPRWALSTPEVLATPYLLPEGTQGLRRRVALLCLWSWPRRPRTQACKCHKSIGSKSQHGGPLELQLTSAPGQLVRRANARNPFQERKLPRGL